MADDTDTMRVDSLNERIDQIGERVLAAVGHPDVAELARRLGVDGAVQAICDALDLAVIDYDGTAYDPERAVRRLVAYEVR